MFENNFTRWHAIVALALWLAFAALTLVIVLRGLDHAAQRPLTVAATVAGSALGPMSGAIGRGLQSCCLAVLTVTHAVVPRCLGRRHGRPGCMAAQSPLEEGGAARHLGGRTSYVVRGRYPVSRSCPRLTRRRRTKRWSRIAIASSGVENPRSRSAHRGRSQ